MERSSPTTREAYDELLRTLVGRRVQRVLYFEVEREQTTPGWSEDSPTFDTLDFGLELHLDDVTLFSFTWDTAFATHDVGIVRATMPRSGSTRVWDATERWGSVVSGPLTSVTADWTTHSPQSLTLRFADRGAVVIASFELGAGASETNLYADQIAVFFDETEARRLTGLP